MHRSSDCINIPARAIRLFVPLLCWCVWADLCCIAAEAGTGQQAEQPRETETLQEAVQDSTKTGFPGQLQQVEKKAEQAAGMAGERFSAYLDEFFHRLPRSPALQWPLVAAAFIGGLAFLFAGWDICRRFFVPVVTISGLAAGGFLGYRVAAVLAEPSSNHIVAAAAVVGMIAGAALFLITSIKAKPFATLLFVLTPFLILSCVLFPLEPKIALALFVGGFVLAAVSMVKLRPMAIIGSSALGAMALAVGWRLLAELLRTGFVARSLQWLTARPIVLVVALAMTALVGTSMQLTIAPGEFETQNSDG